MKAFFKYLFNLTRNISLVLIALVFLFVYLAHHQPELTEKIWKPAEQEEMVFGIAAIPEKTEKAVQLNIDPEQFERTKLSIDLKGGKAFLKPEDIMYVDSGIITTIRKIKIPTANTTTALFEDFLSKEGDYFCKTQKSIINLHYVEQLLNINRYGEQKNFKGKYSYEYKVVFENGDTLNVSRKVMDKLRHHFDTTPF